MSNRKKESAVRTVLSGVPVYCRFDEVRKVADLVENPDNPNRHPQSQIERLAEVIKLAGWRAPITVSDLSGMIVKGHGRLAAAKLAGLEEVPIEIQHYDTLEHERADMIADNHLAELADLDGEALSGLLSDLQEAGSLDMTGFTSLDLEELLKESAGEDNGTPELGDTTGIVPENQYGVIVMCASEKNRKKPTRNSYKWVITAGLWLYEHSGTQQGFRFLHLPGSAGEKPFQC